MVDDLLLLTLEADDPAAFFFRLALIGLNIVDSGIQISPAVPEASKQIVFN